MEWRKIEFSSEREDDVDFWFALLFVSQERRSKMRGLLFRIVHNATVQKQQIWFTLYRVILIPVP